MGKVLKIVEYPKKILRIPSKEIDKITPSVRRLAYNLEATLFFNNAYGVAANQVNYLKRIIVVRKIIDLESDLQDAYIFINPKIEWYSSQLILGEEGCLSLRNLTLPILRSQSIILNAKDIEGNIIQNKFYNIEARVIQHEVDHLNGILIIDRYAMQTI